jgi:resuscitation-promoting factor RpfB
VLAACGVTGGPTGGGGDAPGPASSVADGTMPGVSSDASSGAVAGGPSGGGVTSSPAQRPASSPPAADPAQTNPAGTSVTYRTVTVTQTIPFTSRTLKDATLAAGTAQVRTRGIAGVATLTYRVTLNGGAEASRTLLRRVVTRSPVTQVSVVGTMITGQCDPNYSGACVPIASDVDCVGGGGNGPAYVQGPVRVIGRDIYDLDSDGNGIGCG